jgi:hypothetical protein
MRWPRFVWIEKLGFFVLISHSRGAQKPGFWLSDIRYNFFSHYFSQREKHD